MDRQKKELSDLIGKLRQILPELKEEYSIETIEVFGSYVRGEAHPSSDLDLLVTFSEVPGLFKFITLENHLSEMLGIKVDLVMKDALKPVIGENILKEALPV
jgi:predicted nucleotidyltransferase